jgi:ribosome-binding ATPase YchF (GTP1/OBG family)
MSEQVFQYAEEEGSKAVLVSAQVESELSGLEHEDKQEFLDSLGVSDENCGLKAVITAAYATLGLQTYYTAGPKETKAWTIKKGMTAPQVNTSVQ